MGKLLAAGADTTAVSATGLTPLAAAACAADNLLVVWLMLIYRCSAQQASAAVVQSLVAKVQSAGISKLQLLGDARCVGEGDPLGQVVASLTQDVGYSAEAVQKLCQQLNTANAAGIGGTPAVTGNSVKDGKQAGSGCSSSKPADCSRDKQTGASSSSSKAYQLFEERSPAGKCETLPLHKAAQFGYADTVGLLLAGGADPNYRCCHGYSPLLQVTWRGNSARCDLFLKCQEPHGRTYACAFD